MGSSADTPRYESKDKKLDNMFKMDRKNRSITKRDGTIINSKDQICKNYDESNLPWPFRSLFRLDYCWRVNYQMFKHSFFVAVPITGIHFIYTNMPAVWSMTFKTFPKLLFSINYVFCLLLLNSANLTTSLVFDDYCKRDSPVYNIRERDLATLKGLISDTNK